MAKSIVFFDTEVGVDDKKIHDIGAVCTDKGVFHSSSVQDFCAFVANTEYVCGHNIIHHDIKFLKESSGQKLNAKTIDTLYLSPLLFPKRPYHRLLKDDKLQVEELNNPVNDSQKAKDLFFDEVNAFYNLTTGQKKIFCGLLYDFEEFQGFFDYVGFRPFAYRIGFRSLAYKMPQLISEEYKGKICANSDIQLLVKYYPRELAYALALIGCGDQYSTTPPWLLYNFPKIENMIKFLCNTPCKDGCDYCRGVLDVHKGLKRIFGFNNFRTYDGEPLQEKAARAAVEGKSLLAVFPTGGGEIYNFPASRAYGRKSSSWSDCCYFAFAVLDERSGR